MIHPVKPYIAHVDVKRGQLMAIKAALRLSRRLVHAMMFKVGFYFRSLTTTKPIIKEGYGLFGTPVSCHKFHTMNYIE